MNSSNGNKPEANADFIEATRMMIGNENVKICDSRCESADICVMPDNTEDISKVIAVARKYGVSVASSNNPSWSLDGTKNAGGVLVDLSKLNKIINIDPVAMTVRAGAGCTFESLIEECSKKGFSLGSYPFDRSSAVGTWAVSNQIGYGSYKYGGP
ncbi:MAG: FAD-dependent oxidoreductase, partial [Methanomassiliicoccaceae archaeon]|nr:FAD-dependent oxidoreductase [Methanomassiliicoccaceae archaeon]